MKTKFESRDYGRCVVLTQTNGRVREFHIPYTSGGGGYIREGSNMGPQVCDGLVHRGNTLTATPDSLLSVIHGEWRKYRKSESYRYEINE